MLLRQFPDINLVRNLRNDVSEGGGNAWMNVALNVRCREVSRTGVESPYSLFLNVKGHSFCSVNGHQYRIETDNFLLTQPGDQYDLIVDNIHQTEIFNIHINKEFFEGFVNSFIRSADSLLSDPYQAKTSNKLFTQLYQKDDRINSLIARLGESGADETERFDAILAEIMLHVLSENEQVKLAASRLPLVSRVGQGELFARLAMAKDYMHSNYASPLNLDELCRETAMSKFHFMRMFKALYGCSPYQYLTGVRMQKAAALLKTSGCSINEISDLLGFEYPNSFIKSFQKNYGIAPLQFRKAI